MYPDGEAVFLSLPSFAKEPILRALIYHVGRTKKMNVFDTDSLLNDEGLYDERRIQPLARKGIPVFLVGTEHSVQPTALALKSFNVFYTKMTASTISEAIDKLMEYIGTSKYVKEMIELAKYIAFVSNKPPSISFEADVERLRILFLDKPEWPIGYRSTIKPNSYLKLLLSAQQKNDIIFVEANKRLAAVQAKILALLAAEMYGISKTVVKYVASSGETVYVGAVRGIKVVKVGAEKCHDYSELYGIPAVVCQGESEEEVKKKLTSYIATPMPINQRLRVVLSS